MLRACVAYTNTKCVCQSTQCTWFAAHGACIQGVVCMYVYENL